MPAHKAKCLKPFSADVLELPTPCSGMSELLAPEGERGL
jgi:hypothetical protein